MPIVICTSVKILSVVGRVIYIKGKLMEGMLFLCCTFFGQILAEIISKWSLPSFVNLGTLNKDIIVLSKRKQQR